MEEINIVLSEADAGYSAEIGERFGCLVRVDLHTYVEHPDEIAGAQLLADVHTELARLRGDVD